MIGIAFFYKTIIKFREKFIISFLV